MQESVGILYSIQNFLELSDKNKVDSLSFLSSYTRYYLTTPEIVIKKGLLYNWIYINDDEEVILTESGNEILKSASSEEKLRKQIMHIILESRPNWLRLIPNGRSEVSRYFSENTKQCFIEADLMFSFSPEVVKWWDTLAAVARENKDEGNVEVGRIGEKLTIDYEENRTGQSVIWQSVESNFSGFDVLSILGPSNDTPLKIEVKTSKSNCHFHVTKNEWETARLSKYYLFYLWVLEPEKKLYILDKDALIDHMPNDRGKGKWESAYLSFPEDELSPFKISI
jgi:uncharacterized protein (DUF1697 family)